MTSWLTECSEVTYWSLMYCRVEQAALGVPTMRQNRKRWCWLNVLYLTKCVCVLSQWYLLCVCCIWPSVCVLNQWHLLCVCCIWPSVCVLSQWHLLRVCTCVCHSEFTAVCSTNADDLLLPVFTLEKVLPTPVCPCGSKHSEHSKHSKHSEHSEHSEC